MYRARMNLGGRLKIAREKRGMGQEELAQKVPGASQPQISALEKRDSQTTELLFEFADALRVNPRWLQTGQPENDTGLESTEGWKPGAEELSPDEKELLREYGRLPGDARPAVHEVIRTTLRLVDTLVGQIPTRKSV